VLELDVDILDDDDIIAEEKIIYDVDIIEDEKSVEAEIIIQKLEEEGFVTLYINFDSGKYTIKPESFKVIDDIAAALKARPDMKVKLEGHTDNVGNARANKKLSDDRANAVMNAIVAKGIDISRLSAEGFGLEKPIADNNTAEGRAKNRRVELVRENNNATPSSGASGEFTLDALKKAAEEAGYILAGMYLPVIMRIPWYSR
jgi:outer membrane protein OmpA-like peptidoglycan-associated protein